jgi:hypothetical protein
VVSSGIPERSFGAKATEGFLFFRPPAVELNVPTTYRRAE